VQAKHISRYNLHSVAETLLSPYSNMSVFSLDVSTSNPVTEKDLRDACAVLGVSIKDEERKDYLQLLAVYHDSMAKLMAMEGQPHVFK
jgi:hypothetical protein